METLLSFIHDYGYWLIFFATLLEGETIVALGGFTAFEGYLDLEKVMMVAFLGGLLGDQIFFYVGRLRGKRFIEDRPKLAERARKVHGLIERYPNLLIFASRYMYGFRLLLPIAFGTSSVGAFRFLAFNALGAASWSMIFAGGGYLLGNAIETYLGHFERAEKYVILGVIAGVVLVQTISFLYRRIERRVERAERKVEDAAMDNPNAERP
jgi:membrane protein DedA with SNARE-associated domain